MIWTSDAATKAFVLEGLELTSVLEYECCLPQAV